MSTGTLTEPLTPEDLLRLPDGDRYELVDGQLVERKTSFWSSIGGGNLAGLLWSYCRGKELGWVAGEGTSYQCFPDEPGKVRKPDSSFIRLDRLSMARATKEGHMPIAPDVAGEVVSPHDTVYEVDEKVQAYLRAGTSLVWEVNPQARTVQVHRRNGTTTLLHENDELTGEDVIPGFRCRVAELFEAPGQKPSQP